MFKNSLVLGKFYPCHLGHLYLIDTAVSQSEMVHVIMTHNPSQSIPGEVSFEALKVNICLNQAIGSFISKYFNEISFVVLP